MRNPISKYAYFVCIALITYAAVFFYPRWEKSGSEATLSWDVCGYYYYLPAFFIYNDLKHVAFHKDLDNKYRYQDGDFYSALPLKTTDSLQAAQKIMVMKYSSGMALMYLPAFVVAHTVAQPLGYEADGFSKPYQIAINIWCLLFAFIGLHYLRKVLFEVGFSDISVAITLFLYVIATNYWEYASISSAMTHSFIFTLYAILLYLILKFHEKPTFNTAAKLGLCMGLAVLTRPTEMPIVLVPLLWGSVGMGFISQRFAFFKEHFSKVLVAVFIFILIGSIQLFYWKYTTGHFFYNSYGPEDKMEWRHTHILDGLFSARKGWLVYTPVMLFSLIGFVFLYRKKREYFLTLAIFTLIFIYVSFAHNIWWYGGGLGQRQMIQIYPMLAIPFAAFWEVVLKRKTILFVVSLLTGVCIYLNIWMHYNAHREGYLDAEYTTPAYFRATWGRWSLSNDVKKLLDNKYDFDGEMRDQLTIYKTDYETDTSQNIVNQNVINGKKSLSVDAEHQFSPAIVIPLSNNARKWLRATATLRTTQKEWNTWGMMQWIVKIKKEGKDVKGYMIRPHRIMDANQTKKVWIDCKIGGYDFDKIEVYFWNADSKTQTLVDDLEVDIFN